MEKRLSDTEYIRKLLNNSVPVKGQEEVYTLEPKVILLQALQSGQLIRADRLLSVEDYKKEWCPECPHQDKKQNCKKAPSCLVSNMFNRFIKAQQSKLKGAL